jgi:myo-inositol-1-phosphate synthase
MKITNRSTSRPLLLLIAGAKGAVSSTLAVAIAAMKKRSDTILPSLTTGNIFSFLGAIEATAIAGWDPNTKPLTACIKAQGVVPEHLWKPFGKDLDRVPVHGPPKSSQGLKGQVEHLRQDIQTFKNMQPDAFPDLAYTLAAILSEIPVVNFTPNIVEIPAIIKEAEKRNIPIAGRDGKTGQTYFKVVLASALRARNFLVDANKTSLLDDVLGYEVGQKYGAPSHKVHIDYYPPRGDAKEAWDVIDFSGMFGLPMSLRINLQGRDSILAAPLALDLGRWVAALKLAGRSGLVPELGFYFKKPVGNSPPLTFQDQIQSLKRLEQICNDNISSRL